MQHATTRSMSSPQYRADWFVGEPHLGALRPPVQDEPLRAWLLENIRGRFIVSWFQPILDLHSGQIIGFESLARAWKDGQPVPPMTFIALAQEEGLIDELGDVVLEYALSHAQRLPGEAQNLAVNLTANQLVRPGMVEHFLSTLEDFDSDPRRIMIEVREKTLAGAEPLVFERLADLRSEGFRLLVDNFAARYMSIEQVVAMGASGVKIARRVVDAIVPNPTASTLIESICSVSSNHGLSVTAVGVEEAEQMQLVRGLGCDFVQGFFTGRPLPIDEASALRPRSMH